MEKFFTVDRIEGNIYVLEDDNSNIIDIEACYIKMDAKEGDILKKEGEYYIVDKEKTEKRKKEMDELIKGMWVD